MYKLFLQEHFPEEYLRVQEGVKPEIIRCKIKYEYYRDFFNSHFGYRFGRPRADVCSTCEELRSLLLNETVAECRKAHRERLKLHKLKAKIFYEDHREWEEKAMQNDDTESLSFDFQQNFPFPH
jgi:hypothetical protein